MSVFPPRIPSSCPPGFSGRHVVKSGETMFLIARSLNIPLSRLIAANPHIPNPNVIFPGDILCVPGVLPIPCCVALRLQVPAPVGTDAMAIVHLDSSGRQSVTVVANLPPPSTFGNFNIYLATVLIPEIGGGFGDVLFQTPEEPPTFATTIEIPPVAQLALTSRVVIEPFREVVGITGPVILEGSLASCR